MEEAEKTHLKELKKQEADRRAGIDRRLVDMSAAEKRAIQRREREKKEAEIRRCVGMRSSALSVAGCWWAAAEWVPGCVGQQQLLVQAWLVDSPAGAGVCSPPRRALPLVRPSGATCARIVAAACTQRLWCRVEAQNPRLPLYIFWVQALRATPFLCCCVCRARRKVEEAKARERYERHVRERAERHAREAQGRAEAKLKAQEAEERRKKAEEDYNKRKVRGLGLWAVGVSVQASGYLWEVGTGLT